MKMKCSKCGKEVEVRPAIYKQRIEKFGSEKKLVSTYQCRDCRPKAVQKVALPTKGKKLCAVPMDQAKRDAMNARRRLLRAQKKALAAHEAMHEVAKVTTGVKVAIQSK